MGISLYGDVKVFGQIQIRPKEKQDLDVLEGNPWNSKSSRCWGAVYFIFLVLGANGLFSMFQTSEP